MKPELPAQMPWPRGLEQPDLLDLEQPLILVELRVIGGGGFAEIVAPDRADDGEHLAAHRARVLTVVTAPTQTKSLAGNGLVKAARALRPKSAFVLLS